MKISFTYILAVFCLTLGLGRGRAAQLIWDPGLNGSGTAGSGTSPFWVLGSGATVNVGGNLTSGQQPRLAGAAGSVFNLTGSANAPAIMFVLGTVNLTSGSLIPSSSFYIGYPNPGTINGIPY